MTTPGGTAPDPLDQQGLTTADWLRYAFLAFLASLVFVIVYGKRPYPLLILLAIYLIGAATFLFLRARRSGP